MRGASQLPSSLAAALLAVACSEPAPPPSPPSTQPTAPAAAPAPPPARLAVGTRFSCLVAESHDVICWGDVPRSPGRAPHVVPELHGATEIAAGEDLLCGRIVEGAVVCSSPFGEGFLESSQFDRGRSLVAEGDRVCSIVGDRIVCSGGYGRPSAGPVAESARLVSVGRTICAVGGGSVRCMNRGDDHTWELGGATDVRALADARGACAIRESGALACAEGDHVGAAPLIDTGETGIDAIGGGADTRCTLRGGHLRCEGARRAELDGVLELASNDTHACALRANDEVLCWGLGTDGQTGPASTLTAPMELAARGPRDVVEIARIEHEVLFRDVQGATWRFANGEATRVERLPPYLGYASLGGRLCGIRHDGALACPATGGIGGVRLGATGGFPVPAAAWLACARTRDGASCVEGHFGATPRSLAALHGARDAFVFDGRVCGIRDHAVVCAPAHFTSRTVPGRSTVPAAIADADRIFAGEQQLFAITGGTAVAMGHNGVGQLGLPPSPPIETPTAVTLPLVPDGMAFAQHASCLWARAGALWCAGIDADWLVRGDSDRGDGAWREIVGPRDVVAVAPGDPSIAVTRDGAIWEWGRIASRTQVIEPRVVTLP